MWLSGCLSYSPHHIYGTGPFTPPPAVSGPATGPSPYLSGKDAPAETPVASAPSQQVPIENISLSRSENLNDSSAINAAVRSTRIVPDLGHIYGRTAKSDDQERNPIIVIPGVLGSRLVDVQTNQVVWGQVGGDGIDPKSPWGARAIALPMRQQQQLASLTDHVQPAGTLDALDVRFLGIPFQFNAYRDLLDALRIGGYRDAQALQSDPNGASHSYNSFQFAYDWRRDNVENARRLHQFILEKKAYIEAERRKQYDSPPGPVRFDIVAHSMGGLVARYYLQYGNADLPGDGSKLPVTWAGAEHVERLVMIGTPNAGSLDAIQNLVQGETLSRFLPRYEAGILGTMPALYQLLPRSRQNPVIAEGDRRGVDLLDPRTWAQFRWGLLDPRQYSVVAALLNEVTDPNERQQIVYEHLTKCLRRARAFQDAMDEPAAPPDGTSIHLIAGDAHPTIAQFRVDNHGALTVTSMQPGDSRVTRSSALMDERFSRGVKWSPRLSTPIKWSSVNFLFADHLGLTSDPGFTDNVLFLLLESPR